MKARNLRKVEQHKSVFISPDLQSCTPGAGAQEKMRRIVGQEPNRRHFIKGGKVCSVVKVET